MTSARRYPDGESDGKGQWIKVVGLDGEHIELSSSIPNQIRAGRYQVDPTHFQVTRRSNGCAPGKAVLFIRYVGPVVDGKALM